MTNESNTASRVEAALKGLIEDGAISTDRGGMVSVRVPADHIHAACKALRDEAGFETNTLVTARDHGEGEDERFEVLYQFLSYAHKDRVRVSVMTQGDDPEVQSIRDLWPGIWFSERECYDMFGVRFKGHGDLRRLLMPEGFDHHPLRKDFPHIDIQPDKLYRQWDAARRAEYAAEQANEGGH